jgi:rhamnosyltransferase
MVATASVIMRSLNKGDTIEKSLLSVRAQTAPAEIVVVDSGSTDRTVEIARRYADRVIEIPPESFTYGGALNIGAEAASGDVHFALSAHSTPYHLTWIQDSLDLYARDDVAATNAAARTPRGEVLEGTYYQTAQDVVVDPVWGFSNHGSSWRASVWREHPFREDLAAAEDKEWSWRVLADGWTIAYSPRLAVTVDHRRHAGPVAFTRRILKERGALSAMGAVRPTTAAQALDEWWNPDPYWLEQGKVGPLLSSLAWRRLSPWRMLEIGAGYVADHRTRTPVPVPALAELRKQAGQPHDRHDGAHAS